MGGRNRAMNNQGGNGRSQALREIQKAREVGKLGGLQVPPVGVMGGPRANREWRLATVRGDAVRVWQQVVCGLNGRGGGVKTGQSPRG